MAPTPRAALALALAALSALVLPPWAAGLLAVVVAGAVVIDALTVRRSPRVERSHPSILSRGVEAPLEVELRSPAGGSARVRQPMPPDVRLAPREAEWHLEGTLTPLRRGRHALPAPAVRALGPLGLGAWYHRPGEDGELVVYPDLPSARRIALAVARGRFLEGGQRGRGPLGLGTDFESIRDYLPDDDVRQVNWRATARMARPMSNVYRVDRDRELMCLVDCGRLMAAPLGELTRLDATIDAVTALALVADELGDRVGAVAFDSEVRHHLRPRRDGGRAVVRALFDVEPAAVESDYELAFRIAEGAKRSFVLVLTDLLEPSAAQSLVDAVPVLARRHEVVVASVADEDLARAVTTPPERELDVYAAAAAVDVLDARAEAATLVRRAGASVIESPPRELGAACVRAYLRAKARARL
ncbi:MAG: hypothetical protein QOE06_1777 [Thermoleophilaceae bacterium]|jgi:uncharacterized protein (DUF58 family)|nr:hypothetical protein [Thermoleophilaceae bacterium]